MTITELWVMVQHSVWAWIDDYAPSMGAALAYYTMFSVAPLLVIVIAMAGIMFGNDAAQGHVLAELRGLMGEEGARAVEDLLRSASDPEQSALAAVVGILTLLVGATTVFGELQSALDRIWRATAAATTSETLWRWLQTRLLSLGMILGIGFLLLVSLVMSAALAGLGVWWGPLFGAWEMVLQVSNFIVSFAIVTLVFAMIYKYLPSVSIAWRDVWVGAAVTALLFTIGKLLIGFYLGRTSIASAFGAAGSLVVLLIWVYYSAQIFLLGAEFTWVYAHRHGSRAGQARAPLPATITRG
jgi:membrane protein